VRSEHLSNVAGHVRVKNLKFEPGILHFRRSQASRRCDLASREIRPGIFPASSDMTLRSLYSINTPHESSSSHSLQASSSQTP
jgi:hypothetical protein